MDLFTSFIFMLFLMMSLIIGLIPYVGRKGIEFGVSIPDNEETHTKITKWKRLYFMVNVIGGIVISLPLFILMKKGTTAQVERNLSIYVTVGTIMIVLICMVSYLLIRKQLMNFKKQFSENSKIKQNEKEIVVDLNYRSSRIGIPNTILLLSNGLIIVATAIITWLNYDMIPKTFPIHWGINFEPDRFVNKSNATVFGMIGFQVALALVFYLTNYSLVHAKQSLNPKNPVQSSTTNKAYRQAWSIFTLLISISTQLLMSSIQLVSIIFYTENVKWVIYATALYTVFILSYTIMLSIKYGQGGSRYKKNQSPIDDQNEAEGYDDDKYWKLGLFYYNPDDPSIWVEKRFGIGPTSNMARWQSWAILIGILLLCFLPLLFL